MADFPGVIVEIQDETNLPIASESTSYFCAQGVTQIGVIDKPVFIPNWQTYLETFGGLVDGYDFPLYVKRALEAGGKGFIKPVGHYTDLTDKTTLAGTKATITLTVSTDAVVYTAKAVGAGYNGMIVRTKLAESGNANKLDLTVEFTVEGQKLTQTIRDVPEVPTTAEKNTLNNKLKWIQIGTITNKIPVGNVTLASGVKDNGSILDADYNGNQEEQTGWYGFDDITTAFRIINFDRASPTVDIALANYCINRGDMRFHIRTPTRTPAPFTLTEMQDYRMGTGAYTHTAINTWLGSIWAGDLTIEDPKDETATKSVSAIGDVAGAYFKKGKDGEWFSVASEDYRTVGNQLGVEFNIGSPSLKEKAKTAYGKGLNFVFKHSSLGVVLWGNNSLYQVATSQLTKENVAELVMLIRRKLPALVDTKMFKPNDPKTWTEIYNIVKPFIRELEENRAIIRGEGTNWQWQGDQDLGSLSELNEDSVNKIADVQAGRYKAIFRFKPISAVEFITLQVTPTDAGLDVSLVG